MNSLNKSHLFELIVASIIIGAIAASCFETSRFIDVLSGGAY